jgi:hypothetical protein
MTPKDAISNVLRNGTNSAGLIFISNAEGTCAKLNARQQPRNVQVLALEVGTQSSSGAASPTGPGVFPVYSAAESIPVTGAVAIALFQSSDANCRANATFESATGGNVTLTRVDANGYAGTFDVTFSGNVGHVTGSFDTARCAVLGTTTGGTCT